MKTFDTINEKRRKLLYGTAGALATGLLPMSALAQGIGGSVVKIVIASTPGTGGDTMARLLQPQLQSRWKQSFVVENKPGASGVIGIDAVAMAPPDGHTFMIQTSTMFLLPYFYKQMQCDVLKSFQPLTQVGWSTFALVVNPNVPAKDYREFVRWVKGSNGKLNYASPGNGTENHIFMEMLKLTAGLTITHVPYKGASGAIQDVLAGRVQMMFLPVQTAMVWAKGGHLRIIGVTMKDRFPLFPEIPSLNEQGAAHFDFTNWYGAWAPAGISADVTAKYNSVLRASLTLPEITKKFADQGWVVKVGSPEELAKLSRSQYEAWGHIVEKTHIKAA